MGRHALPAVVILFAASLAASSALAGCSSPREQHEITVPGELLTADGRLREPGWSSRELLHFDSARVHDPKRLRAWDFFTIWNGSAAINLTLVDLGYLQVASVGVVDYATGVLHSSQSLGGILSLSPGLEGSASFRADATSPPQMSFTTAADAADATTMTTTVAFDIPPFFGAASRGSFTIRRRASLPFLSLATPFDDDPTNFFFEHKIPGLTAEGTVTIGDRTFTFADADSSAVMDWGRGQWPAELIWRWAGGSGTIDGTALSFNLGEGFGDDACGTENLVVFGDIVTKLGRVVWSFDRSDPMQPWSFRSADGRIDLTLHPLAPEVGGIDLGDKFNLLTKAYGTFSGTITLDGGRTLKLAAVQGFAEENDVAW